MEKHRFRRPIDNDAAVGSNYQRLVSHSLEDAFEWADFAITPGGFVTGCSASHGPQAAGENHLERPRMEMYGKGPGTPSETEPIGVA